MTRNPDDPLIFELFQFPLTTVLIAVCLAVWMMLRKWSFDYDVVGVSYRGELRK